MLIPTAAANGSLIAHDGVPLEPHDAIGAWTFDPLTTAALATIAVLYWRGWRPPDGARRAWAWWTGWIGLVVALLSPLEALSVVLMSAHMTQHVILIAVVAPLVAASAPQAALIRGLPSSARQTVTRVPRQLGFRRRAMRSLRRPGGRWLAFVLSFWLWHSSVLYDAAVDSDWVHAIEHTTFLGTALLLWSALIGPHRIRVDRGQAVVLVFVLGLQSVLLAALITFAEHPWYESYSIAAPGWGLDPLADQRLAGAIMWVPSGLVTTAIAIRLLVLWLRELDSADDHDQYGHARDDSQPRRMGTST